MRTDDYLAGHHREQQPERRPSMPPPEPQCHLCIIHQKNELMLPYLALSKVDSFDIL